MTTSKAAKKRKGCWVCGVRFVRDHSLPAAIRNTCLGCLEGPRLAATYPDPYEKLYLIVDGAFTTQSGQRNINEPGYGGAGLVLVEDGTDVIVALRSCGFATGDSAEAEFQAIVRGARWIPNIAIFTDSKSHVERATGELRRDVMFLSCRSRKQSSAHDIAHELSVEGRIRFSQQATEPENEHPISRESGTGNSHAKSAV